jgi:hypothetical protein
MADYSGQTVAEILKLKKARIKNAPLAKGSPSWDEILDLEWEEIEERKRRGEPGFKTIHKLLQSKEYDKK